MSDWSLNNRNNVKNVINQVYSCISCISWSSLKISIKGIGSTNHVVFHIQWNMQNLNFSLTVVFLFHSFMGLAIKGGGHKPTGFGGVQGEVGWINTYIKGSEGECIFQGE